MGASCSSKKKTSDFLNGSASTMTEDPVLLDLGFGAAICRLYRVIHSHDADNTSFKVVGNDFGHQKSGLRHTMIAPDPSKGAHEYRMLLLKRVAADNPISVLSWYNTLDTLSRLDHCGLPRVIDIHDEGPNQLSFVMETCDGGPILDRAPLSERNARKVVRQILEIVVYLHSHNIVHGDLRAEWFQFETSDPRDWRLKLTDFCFMVQQRGQQRDSQSAASFRRRLWHDQQPSLHASAPEVLNGRQHSKKADMWSVGVILYQLLCAKHPFGDSTSSLMLNMQEGPTLAFQQSIWRRRSRQVKDLIRRLLAVDAKYRLSAEEAIKHGWFHHRGW